MGAADVPASIGGVATPSGARSSPAATPGSPHADVPESTASARPRPLAVTLGSETTVPASSAGEPGLPAVKPPSVIVAVPTPTAVQAGGVTPGSSPAATASPAASAAAVGSANAQATALANILNTVVILTNQQRALVGCPALVADPALALVAQAHSVDMATANYLAHNSGNGATPFQRISAAGIAYVIAAENIAAGQPTPDAVVRAWMASPGHRANILNCSLRRIGVGFAGGGSSGACWTQDFIAPPR
ncbi:CAP domain-containing protein [Candidatus Frankia nodulisporulans]|uniref:CAP domain-containing protein n=1 Tax=Candidatus Frankia nodulisporulans TaxID=2060052 RepID=UPI00370484C3